MAAQLSRVSCQASSVVSTVAGMDLQKACTLLCVFFFVACALVEATANRLRVTLNTCFSPGISDTTGFDNRYSQEQPGFTQHCSLSGLLGVRKDLEAEGCLCYRALLSVDLCFPARFVRGSIMFRQHQELQMRRRSCQGPRHCTVQGVRASATWRQQAQLQHRRTD